MIDLSKEWWLIRNIEIFKLAFDINWHFKNYLCQCKLAIQPQERSLLVDVTGINSLAWSIHREDFYANLKILAQKLNLGCVKLVKYGEIIDSIRGTIMLDFKTSQEQKILEEIYHCPYHMTVVRRTDGKVLLCSPQLQTRDFCEMDATDIIGCNAKRVWLPEEWEKRDIWLGKDGIIANYEYEGYRMVEVLNQENPPLHKFVGDFRLDEFYETEVIVSKFRFANT